MWGKKSAVALCVAAAVATLSGCSSQTVVGSSTQPCYPDFTQSNQYGTLSARQASSGSKAIAWGVYPKGTADAYTVYIYVNGVQQDQKVAQYYPPHGSISGIRGKNSVQPIPAGAIFELQGTARSGSNVASFWLTCRSR